MQPRPNGSNAEQPAHTQNPDKPKGVTCAYPRKKSGNGNRDPDC
jgi:hypothetical protein